MPSTSALAHRGVAGIGVRQVLSQQLLPLASVNILPCPRCIGGRLLYDVALFCLLCGWCGYTRAPDESERAEAQSREGAYNGHVNKTRFDALPESHDYAFESAGLKHLDGAERLGLYRLIDAGIAPDEARRRVWAGEFSWGTPDANGRSFGIGRARSLERAECIVEARRRGASWQEAARAGGCSLRSAYRLYRQIDELRAASRQQEEALQE